MGRPRIRSGSRNVPVRELVKALGLTHHLAQAPSATSFLVVARKRARQRSFRVWIRRPGRPGPLQAEAPAAAARADQMLTAPTYGLMLPAAEIGARSSDFARVAALPPLAMPPPLPPPYASESPVT